MSNVVYSKKISFFLRASAVGLSLTGCEGIKQSLGIGKTKAPDEFMVTTYPALTLPPDFALRAPQPGAPNRNTGSSVDRAETAISGVLNNNNQELGSSSAGEASLIESTGIKSVPSDIRRLVEQETSSINRSNRSLLSRLFSSRGPASPGVVLDPVAEQKRIADNIAAGRPITTGATPNLKLRKRSFFDSLFNN